MQCFYCTEYNLDSILSQENVLSFYETEHMPDYVYYFL